MLQLTSNAALHYWANTCSDPKYCNSVGDAMAIAPHQFQLINRNRYNPHDPVG
ncbi:hypothetical protein GTQ43_38185 [Nostoc sp. KVJ3]|uniref:hypothetical protein n=1 Tax=Nostoc sp. KVJ3 TaxID=457945 RepID=UPI0022374DCF|nr:hypothetical protein [Nostoc sp. KVJ3]MCW5319217.1 hypothetical protein [Nostoc sp. KVJ3]